MYYLADHEKATDKQNKHKQIFAVIECRASEYIKKRHKRIIIYYQHIERTE